MKSDKFVIWLILILIALIFIHGPILNVIGNINSLFKKDNTAEMKEELYKNRIEFLEEKLSTYEVSLDNLKIYDGESYVLSKVSLRNIYDFYDYVMISTDSLVKKGAAVVNEKGLVGLVTASDSMSAKVSLLTGGKSISVKIGDNYGQLDQYDKKENLFIVHNINNYKKIDVGALVETSGLDGITGSLRVGVVEKTLKKGIEQLVYVRSDVNFDDLNYLYCIEK